MSLSPSERPPRVPNLVRKLAIPIAIFWLALAASTNALVPPLEEVGRVHNVAQSPKDASAVIASQRVGKVFGEYDSDSLATIVIEGLSRSVSRRTATATPWLPA